MLYTQWKCQPLILEDLCNGSDVLILPCFTVPKQNLANIYVNSEKKASFWPFQNPARGSKFPSRMKKTHHKQNISTEVFAQEYFHPVLPLTAVPAPID